MVYTQVLLGSDDVSSYVNSWVITKVGDAELDSAIVNFTRDMTHSVTVGENVSIYRSSVLVFSGVVVSFKKKGALIEVRCSDKSYDLMTLLVNDSWSSQKPSDIVKSILSGTSLSSAGVQDSSVTLNKWVVRNDYAFNVIKKLAEIEDWQFYVDVNGVFYFEPKGYSDSGATLTVGINCFKLGEWKVDLVNLVNSLTVYGKRQTLKKIEGFTGDGSTTEFVLSYKPIDFVRVTVDGTEKKGGIQYASADAEYYVDEDDKKITFVTAPASGSSVSIEYGYGVPLVISADNEDSINTYGRREGVEYTSISTRDDLLEYVNKKLAFKSNPVTGGVLETTYLGLDAGQTVTVVDSVNGVNDLFVVKKVKEYFPQRKCKVEVGRLDFRLVDKTIDLEERLRRVESELMGTSEWITKVKGVTESFEEQGNQDYLKAEHRTNSGMVWNKDTAVWGSSTWGWTSFILGHSSQAVLGSSKVGGYVSPYVTDVEEYNG